MPVVARRPFVTLFLGAVAFLGSVGRPAPACGQATTAPPPAADLDPQEELEGYLGLVRQIRGMPGLAVVTVNDEGILSQAVAGRRVHQVGPPLEPTDPFHVGSCTKAMTATAIAALVAEGVLDWEDAIGSRVDVPDDAGGMDEGWASVTLADLLRHRAGAPGFMQRTPAQMRMMKDLAGSPREQRLAFARTMLAEPPVRTPGEGMVYSNGGYALAAVMAEQAADMSWEDLLRTRVFEPLEMTTAGFGWPGEAGTEPEAATAPWGHVQGFGEGDRPALRPLDPGIEYELTPSLAPAGDVHCSIGDFGRFLVAHLRLLRDEPGVLEGSEMRWLHEPVDRYAGGWIVVDQWGQRISTHDGSAGTFYLTTFILPESNFAVAVAANAGHGQQACRVIAEEMINRHLGPAEEDASETDRSDGSGGGG